MAEQKAESAQPWLSRAPRPGRRLTVADADEVFPFPPVDLRFHVERLDQAAETLAGATELRPLAYVYDPEPAKPLLEEGVTVGWLVSHNGPGPGRAMKVAALVDAGGVVSIEPDGEWQPVTIVDDTEETDRG